ncbi:DUF6635 family protein [Salipiger sp. HF18]|uniref:DUF6635 family protein n=1 Tax=Salipiger sp. HF18 TaxID=2721557 RepID=UPI0020CB6750|nr:DUF6635 family protein [Salipiger sp. HF18]
MTAQPPGTPEDPKDAQARAFFDAARGRIDGFVARNFSVTGSAAMHRRAFGLDLLRAPLNVVLAPIHALTRLFALIARLLRASRLAGWLDRRSFVLPTRVAAEVEARLVHELLGIKRPAKAPRGLSRQLEQAPELRQLLRDGESPGAIAARTRAAADTIAAYSGTRSAMAELTTALLTVVFGAWVFRRLTLPYLAPALASAAVIAFMASMENYNTTMFAKGAACTFATEIGAMARNANGHPPVINAVGTVIILLTVAGAVAHTLLKRKEQGR